MFYCRSYPVPARKLYGCVWLSHDSGRSVLLKVLIFLASRLVARNLTALLLFSLLSVTSVVVLFGLPGLRTSFSSYHLVIVLLKLFQPI